MKIVIRNDEKKDKAVSAIIGTILIVAITVVLAATLYAVLGGFGGLIGKPTPTASMTVSSSGVGGASETYTLTFTSVSTNVSLTDVIVRVTVGSNTYSTSALATSSGIANVTFSTITGSTSNYVVASGSGTYLTYDTTITINIKGTSTTPSLSTIALIYTPSGGDIAGPENV
jgi:flagellin-like protein